LIGRSLIERGSDGRLSLTDAGRAVDEIRAYEQAQALLKEINAQTDRGAAIIAAQELAENLKSLILARFREIPRKQQNQTFRYTKRASLVFFR
jgi:DNA-binding transcriptional LysR family regulator